MDLSSLNGTEVDLDERNLQLLRIATKCHAENLAFDAGAKVLEVGPPRPRKAKNSAVFRANPEWFYDLRSGSVNQYEYYDLDMDPMVSADFCGDLGSSTLTIPKSFFDYVICFSVLEHVPNLNQAVLNLFDTLKPGGVAHIITPWDLRFHGPRPDCWRISDDAYEYLLSPYASMIKITKIDNPLRPLSPVGLIVEAVKTSAGD